MQKRNDSWCSVSILMQGGRLSMSTSELSNLPLPGRPSRWPRPGAESSGWLGGSRVFDAARSAIWAAPCWCLDAACAFLLAILLVTAFISRDRAAERSADEVRRASFCSRRAPAAVAAAPRNRRRPRSSRFRSQAAGADSGARAGPVEPPPPSLNAPVQTKSGAMLQATGSSSVSLSQLGGGGRGTGIGTGTGNGLGEGSGAVPAAASTKSATACHRRCRSDSQDPTYTSEAMRAKVQGEVARSRRPDQRPADRHQGHQVTRPDVRARPGGRRGRQEVAVQARHEGRQACAGAASSSSWSSDCTRTDSRHEHLTRLSDRSCNKNKRPGWREPTGPFCLPFQFELSKFSAT